MSDRKCARRAQRLGKTQQRKTRARLEAVGSRGDLLWRQTAAIDAEAGVQRIGRDTCSRGDADEHHPVSNCFIVGPGGKTGVKFHCNTEPPRPPTATFRRRVIVQAGRRTPMMCALLVSRFCWPSVKPLSRLSICALKIQQSGRERHCEVREEILTGQAALDVDPGAKRRRARTADGAGQDVRRSNASRGLCRRRVARARARFCGPRHDAGGTASDLTDHDAR